MKMMTAVFLVSLVLAGCASTPLAGPGGHAASRHPAIAVLTPAPFVLPAASPRLPELEEADSRAKRQVDLAQVWILGKWETFDRRSGSVEGTGQFEFRREGMELKWRMVRSGWVSGVHTTQTASGSVKQLSADTVEMNGRYESSNLGNVVGTPVHHSLTRDGNRLRGYEAASDGTQSLLSLKRAP